MLYVTETVIEPADDVGTQPMRRAKGVERVAQILDMAEVQLARHGGEGLSVRAVAQALDISVGNLQYYFATRAELLDAVFRRQADRFRQELTERLETEGGEARTDLLVVVDYWLAVQFDHSQSLFWHLWAISAHDDTARTTMTSVYDRLLDRVAKLLRTIHPRLVRREALRARRGDRRADRRQRPLRRFRPSSERPPRRPADGDQAQRRRHHRPSRGGEAAMSERSERIMSDTSETPESVVDRAYELISFAAGGAPAWDEFRALFTDPCVLALRVFPGDEAITVMDLDRYVEVQCAQGSAKVATKSSPAGREVTLIGDIAIVHQAFTMTFADAAPIPATDVFQLARLDGVWRITAIASDTVES